MNIYVLGKHLCEIFNLFTFCQLTVIKDYNYKWKRQAFSLINNTKSPRTQRILQTWPPQTTIPNTLKLSFTSALASARRLGRLKRFTSFIHVMFFFCVCVYNVNRSVFSTYLPPNYFNLFTYLSKKYIYIYEILSIHMIFLSHCFLNALKTEGIKRNLVKYKMTSRKSLSNVINIYIIFMRNIRYICLDKCYFSFLLFFASFHSVNPRWNVTQKRWGGFFFF